MTSASDAIAKSCCADLYQSPLARMLLGETLHPGGLGLTHRMGRLMGIPRDGRVLDLASGRGVSALAVSRAFQCNVVGLEFGAAAIKEARQAAEDSPAESRAAFVRGDAERLPFGDEVFDAVLCECSMSIFPDKPHTTREVARALRPGGRFGMSDVTIEPSVLPPELRGDIGNILCLTGALTVDGYIRLLEDAGFELVETLDASSEITAILDDVEARLGFLIAAQQLVGLAGSSPLGQAPRLIEEMRRLVEQGRLGYWCFIGEKGEKHC
jgi:SAM-dependent methyltransferase